MFAFTMCIVSLLFIIFVCNRITDVENRVPAFEIMLKSLKDTKL
jgi:hypothetical protein